MRCARLEEMTEIIFCSAENCQNAPRVKGVCATHYERERQNSSPRFSDPTPHPTCSVSHCDIEATSRKEGSLCQPHYQKKYRGIDPETYVLPEDHPYRSKPPCAEPGCERLSRSNELCDYHRTRARQGKAQATVSVKRTDPCKFEGCVNASAQGGWCHSHYEQIRLGGVAQPLREYGRYVKGELKCPIPGCRRPQQTASLCANHLRMCREYGVSIERLTEIWSDPKCQNPECGSTTRLHMDHDHETGEFRGLLCNGCNTALGLLKENVDRIRGLAKYKTLHG